MVLAYHVIFGAYGFWLPNDPRGSWSEFVASWDLFRVGGKATTTNSRRSVANHRHDSDLREKTKRSLKYPPVVFDGHQAVSIANGFAEMVAKSAYRIYACAILPEHVHLVLGRHHYKVESMVRLLKAQASQRLARDDRHPMSDWARSDGSLHSPWSERCWRVFLDDDDDVERSIRYVEENPAKEGKRQQHWPFIQPYAGDTDV